MSRHILDGLYKQVALHLPVRLIYWCSMRCIADAAHDRDGVAEPLTCLEAIGNWCIKYGGMDVWGEKQ